jgi:hypothetical protein
MATIIALPQDCLRSLFQYVDFYDRECHVAIVCKLFKQIVNHSDFEEERKFAKLITQFPSKLIEAIGGKKKFFSIPVLDQTETLFKKEGFGLLCGKESAFLAFTMLVTEDGNNLKIPALIYHEYSENDFTEIWKIKTVSYSNPGSKLIDSDYRCLKNLFAGNECLERIFQHKMEKENLPWNLKKTVTLYRPGISESKPLDFSNGSLPTPV